MLCHHIRGGPLLSPDPIFLLRGLRNHFQSRLLVRNLLTISEYSLPNSPKGAFRKLLTYFGCFKDIPYQLYSCHGKGPRVGFVDG